MHEQRDDTGIDAHIFSVLMKQKHTFELKVENNFSIILTIYNF